MYCKCPKLRVNRKYLVMAKASSLVAYKNPMVTELEKDDEDDEVDVDDDDEEAGVVVEKPVYDQAADESEASRPRVANSTILVKRKKDMSMVNQTPKLAGIMVDRDTLIIDWRSEYTKRLRRMIKAQATRCS